MHDGASSFCLRQASCRPSNGCVTSTAQSCPARPSVSSTTSSSSRWPAGWPTRHWRGSSWRPSASSTCPWAPSGKGRPGGGEGEEDAGPPSRTAPPRWQTGPEPAAWSRPQEGQSLGSGPFVLPGWLLEAGPWLPWFRPLVQLWARLPGSQLSPWTQGLQPCVPGGVSPTEAAGCTRCLPRAGFQGCLCCARLPGAS